MSAPFVTDLTLGAGLLGLCPLPATPEQRAELLAWRPDLVISLTEADEMARLGAGALGAILADHAVDWLRIPLADYSVPDLAQTATWLGLSSQILGRLQAGGRIAIHCRGGCGRTGMLALRLMVDAGEAPDLSFARLRKARPCAVETEDQRLWATR